MTAHHKDKTTATLIAVLLGGTGLHRFYLFGKNSIGGWAYIFASAIYCGIVAVQLLQDTIGTSVLVLFPLPVYIAFIEALAMGVTEDNKWDARYNVHSGRQSRSRWPLAVLLVCSFAAGIVALITSMARATDLLYTGGAFG
jgi:TM2 domain-containing membrane protein YozV